MKTWSDHNQVCVAKMSRGDALYDGSFNFNRTSIKAVFDGYPFGCLVECLSYADAGLRMMSLHGTFPTWQRQLSEVRC